MMEKEKIAGQIERVERTIEYLDANNRKVKLSTSIVRQFFCPTANETEAITFIQHCKMLRANPWLRQIYLIKYDPKAPAQIVISRDFFFRLVSSMPNYRGMRSGVIVKKAKPIEVKLAEDVVETVKSILADYELSSEVTEQLTNLYMRCLKNVTAYEDELIEIEGAIVPPGCELYGGWCEIYLKHPENSEKVIVIKQRVMLSEYNRQQATWRTMPATMIQACAERQAARKAFSEVLGGVYGPEELGIPVTPEGTPLEAPQVAEVTEVSDAKEKEPQPDEAS